MSNELPGSKWMSNCAACGLKIAVLRLVQHISSAVRGFTRLLLTDKLLIKKLGMSDCSDSLLNSL